MDEVKRVRFSQRGQIGLIVLLIGSVLLTLGIGIASQSVLETKTARQEVESSAVFNVAEKLIERALSGLSIEEAINVSDYQTALQSDQVTTFEATIPEGEVGEILLSSSSNNLNISWTNTGNCSTEAAVVISIIYGDNGQNVRRYAVDNFGGTDTCRGTGGNGFITSTNRRVCVGSSCGTVQQLGTMPGNPRLARIKVLYADTTVSVSGVNLPTQAMRYTATAQDELTEETRSIEAERGNPVLPHIFDYALYSGSGDISK